MIRGYWCFKVLPLVYDGSLSYYEVLCRITEYLNNIINDVKNMGGDVNEIKGEIEVINAEIERLSGAVDGTVSDVSSLKVRCDALENGMRSVGSSIDTLFQRTDSLGEDVSELAEDLHETELAVEGVRTDLESVERKVPFSFGVDEQGNYGYYKEGADTVTPFSSGTGGKHFEQFFTTETITLKTRMAVN